MSTIDINNWVLQALHYQNNLASESELKEHANAALSAFNNADIDVSKSLTVPELRSLCFEMGLPMENDEEEALMKIDADDSGQITIDEWIIWWLKRVSSLPNPVKQQEAIARSTFQKFDVDKSNFLDIVELQELLKCLGVNFSPIEMEEVLNQLDTDHSGRIEMNEFVEWWSQRSIKSRSGGGLIAIKLRKLARKAAQLFFTDIFTAVWNNDINLVKLFVESDSRIGSSSDVSIYGDGWQPLHYACYKGHYEIVNELLDINVNVNGTNDLGFTPLFYAAQMGFIDICKILLEKGADPAVSGGVADSNVFMCPVDHAIDYPELQKIFKIHPRCKPPQQPPTTGLSGILESNNMLSIQIPPLKLYSILPIKKWHIIISTLTYSNMTEGGLEMFIDGLNPSSKNRDNSNDTLTVNIDKKWLKLKLLSDNSLPVLVFKISAINSLNDKSPYSEHVPISVSTKKTKSLNESVAPVTKDEYEDFNEFKEDGGGEGKEGEEEEVVKDEEIERLRKEIEGDDDDFQLNMKEEDDEDELLVIKEGDLK